MNELLTTLIRIKNGAYNHNPSHGICGHLKRNHIPTDQLIWFREACKRWPKYSGNPVYPVPAPPSFFKTDAARGWHHDRAAMVCYPDYSKWTGAYGALRFELLEFVIEEILQCLRVE